jgi:hypothetical protein
MSLDFVMPTKVEIAVRGIELTALKKLSLVSHALASKIPGEAGREQKCLASVLDDMIRAIEIAAASAPAPDEARALREALRDLLPYARTCVPHPINVGEINVIEKAERLLGGRCADCGGFTDEHVSNYYCPAFRAALSSTGDKSE